MFYFVFTNPVGLFTQGQIQTFFLAGGEMCFHNEKSRVEIKDKKRFAPQEVSQAAIKTTERPIKRAHKKVYQSRKAPPPPEDRRGEGQGKQTFIC